jgi:hypothetical protein
LAKPSLTGAVHLRTGIGQGLAKTATSRRLAGASPAGDKKVASGDSLDGL